MATVSRGSSLPPALRPHEPQLLCVKRQAHSWSCPTRNGAENKKPVNTVPVGEGLRSSDLAWFLCVSNILHDTKHSRLVPGKDLSLYPWWMILSEGIRWSIFHASPVVAPCCSRCHRVPCASTRPCIWSLHGDETTTISGCKGRWSWGEERSTAGCWKVTPVIS